MKILQVLVLWGLCCVPISQAVTHADIDNLLNDFGLVAKSNGSQNKLSTAGCRLLGLFKKGLDPQKNDILWMPLLSSLADIVTLLDVGNPEPLAARFEERTEDLLNGLRDQGSRVAIFEQIYAIIYAIAQYGFSTRDIAHVREVFAALLVGPQAQIAVVIIEQNNNTAPANHQWVVGRYNRHNQLGRSNTEKQEVDESDEDEIEKR